MTTPRFTSLIVLMITATGVQAQLRSVTRPTLQLPLGTPALLQPQAGNLSPAIGTATAPTITYVRLPRRNQGPVDLAERERAQLQFEIQCAERGLPSFQFSLAGRYLTGKGVPRDPEKALELLKRAAEKGHDKARSVVEEFEQFLARQEQGERGASSAEAESGGAGPGQREVEASPEGRASGEGRPGSDESPGAERGSHASQVPSSEVRPDE